MELLPPFFAILAKSYLSNVYAAGGTAEGTEGAAHLSRRHKENANLRFRHLTVKNQEVKMTDELSAKQRYQAMLRGLNQDSSWNVLPKEPH